MNQLFFSRNIYIQDIKQKEEDSQKQTHHQTPIINNKDELYSSHRFFPANKLTNTLSVDQVKTFKKYTLNKSKVSQNKMKDEDHRIFLLMKKLEAEKLTNKKQNMSQVDLQNFQNQEQQKSKTGISVDKYQNFSEKNQRLSNCSKSLSKKKLNLSFVKKSKPHGQNRCLSEKFQIQPQTNNEFSQQIDNNKKHQRRLSTNTMKQTYFQGRKKYPKLNIQLQYQKRITQRSIQASPSNKLNNMMTCQSCGKFLVNMQIFCQKGQLHHKKIKQQLKEAKQCQKRLLQQMLNLRNQLKKQLQNIGVNFVNMIKNFTYDYKQNSIKLKTQQNKNNQTKKQRDFQQKLNRSAVFESQNQFLISFTKKQQKKTKKTEKSQVSSKTPGKIKKNYHFLDQQSTSPQILRIKKKQNIQKFDKLQQSLHLQMRSKNQNRILKLIEDDLVEDKLKNPPGINFGRIVSRRDQSHTEGQVKSSAPTTCRVNNKKEQYIEGQKHSSQSFIKREENYQQCYTNIRDALDKIKQSLL